MSGSRAQILVTEGRLFSGQAEAVFMGSRMNTIMQVCFFAISKVLPGEEAIEAIRQSIRDTYGRKGEEIVQKNMRAVDETLAHLFEVKIPESASSQIEIPTGYHSYRSDVVCDRLERYPNPPGTADPGSGRR